MSDDAGEILTHLWHLCNLSDVALHIVKLYIDKRDLMSRLMCFCEVNVCWGVMARYIMCDMHLHLVQSDLQKRETIKLECDKDM